MKIERSNHLNVEEYNRFIKMALTEDLGGTIDLKEDITTMWTLKKGLQAEAKIISRQDGVIAGLEIAKSTFHHLDPGINFPFIKMTASLYD